MIKVSRQSYRSRERDSPRTVHLSQRQDLDPQRRRKGEVGSVGGTGVRIRAGSGACFQRAAHGDQLIY